jgi:hypothetical protein
VVLLPSHPIFLLFTSGPVAHFPVCSAYAFYFGKREWIPRPNPFFILLASLINLTAVDRLIVIIKLVGLGEAMAS